ncbi:MAG: tripartite tricarboxylate transporter substrate binding protein [Nitrospinota bacterium]|nr:MAG: tripartite tricarboxylate transporter substrate binding protein [Nitrospinota bacterium]
MTISISSRARWMRCGSGGSSRVSFPLPRSSKRRRFLFSYHPGCPARTKGSGWVALSPFQVLEGRKGCWVPQWKQKGGTVMRREGRFPGWKFGIGTVILCLMLLLVWGGSDVFAAWQPRKPIELVVMAGRGGGADRIARLMQSVIQQHNWSPRPIIVVNKGGGAGAEALTYMMSKKGDPHVLMVTLNSFFTTPIRAKLPVTWRDLTPIGRLAMDTFLLWVHADTPYKTAQEYIDACKKKGPGKCIMGGTGRGQEDSIVTAMLEKEFGVQFTYVPFKGGGKVAAALIGKQVDSTVNNPSEQIDYWRAGKSRPLAQFLPERLPTFPDVPTFAELGHPGLVYYMQRSIIAAGGIPAEAKQYYVDLVKKFFDSEEWQKYTKSEGLEAAWLTGDELNKFFEEQTTLHKKLIEELGTKRIFGE